MRPRWELRNDNHYAAIISKAAPYGLLLKLTDRLITDMRTSDLDSPDDRPVGYIVHPDTGRYEPAELLDDDKYKFLHYINAGDPMWDKPNALEAYRGQMVGWGQHWAQRSQPLPSNIEERLSEEDEEEPFVPRGRNRGQQKRRA
jgi:hypothetical protein